MYDLLNDSVRFQGHGVMFRPMNALNVVCAQLTRDLFAIAKFLLWYLAKWLMRTEKWIQYITGTIW